ncbi:hypothetical protein C8Q73DRAFT_789405 [Cubamyces lactineus]|nr:hypothetical protein C8Q73DRAFT_789405 [Cubamyces lactineus]
MSLVSATTRSRLSTNEFIASRNQFIKQQAALSREILSMSRAFNASQPINQLPPELLSRVFYFLQGNDDNRYNRHWYCVAAVCSYWREVANDCMLVWKRITLILRSRSSYAHSSNLFLTRPGVPIPARWRPTGGFQIGPFERFEPEVEGRIMGPQDRYYYSPSFLSCSACTQAKLSYLLQEWAILTEDMSVHAWRELSDRDSTVSDDQETDDEYEDEDEADGRRKRDWRDDVRDSFKREFHAVAALHMPADPATLSRLKSLTLLTIDIVNLIPLPNLRKLELSKCLEGSVSTSAFFAFISGSQALEELTLRMFRLKDDHLPGVIGQTILGPIPPLRPVSVPMSLMVVTIEDVAPWTARILEGMFLGKKIKLSVSMTAGTDPPTSPCIWDTPVHTAVPVERSHIDVFRCADTLWVDTDRLTYHIFANTPESEPEHATLTITADVERESRDWDSRTSYHLPAFLTDLVRLFHKSPVVNLTVCADGTINQSLTEENWAHMFKHLSYIRQLAMSMNFSVRVQSPARTNDHLSPVFKILSRSAKKGNTLCPNLETLIIRFHGRQQETSSIPNLLEYLRIRYARGRALTHIRIMLDGHHDMNDADRAALKQSALERYRNIFQPYVGTVSCGDVSYFYLHQRS